jgi:putative sterol carrier protein
MPAYLSRQWVQAFNTALAGLDLTEAIAAAGAASLTVAQGTFSVAQVVTDGPPNLTEELGGTSSPDSSPDGSIRTVLTVDDGRIALVADPSGTTPANVTIVLTYADAIAVARGELHPADALAAGRVRVRGELSVLVAGQSVLNAAAAILGQTLVDLTDPSEPRDLTEPRDTSEPRDPTGAAHPGE